MILDTAMNDTRAQVCIDWSDRYKRDNH